MKQILLEKFASPMLAKLAKEHGGISRWINGGMRNSTNAWYRGDSIDLATVTDEMLDKPFQYYKAPYERNLDITIDQRDNMILFNDGWAVALKPYSYHKYNGTDEPQKKPVNRDKYGSGIGDTGDHDRTPSPFVAGGGKTQGQVYNPYGVSTDAARANGIRTAFNNNLNDQKYWAKEAEKYRNQAEEARRNGDMTLCYSLLKRAEEAENQKAHSSKNMSTLKKSGSDLLKNHQRGSVTPIPMQETNTMRKKLVITQEQFRRMNEGDAHIVVPFNGNTPQQADAAYKDARNQIDFAKSHSDNGDITVDLQGSGFDENKPQQTVALDPNNPNVSTQLDSSLFNANPGVQVQDKEVYTEGKAFTKKQLEEARIRNIKANGKHYTKKAIKEGMFSPALTVVEWTEVLKKAVQEFVNNVENDQEVQSYLIQAKYQGSDFPACLDDVMSSARSLLYNIDDLEIIRP